MVYLGTAVLKHRTTFLYFPFTLEFLTSSTVGGWLSGDTTAGYEKDPSKVDWSDPKYSRFSPAERQEGKQTVPQHRVLWRHRAGPEVLITSLHLWIWWLGIPTQLTSNSLAQYLSAQVLCFDFLLLICYVSVISITTLVSFDKEELKKKKY